VGRINGIKRKRPNKPTKNFGCPKEAGQQEKWREKT
jgi:hypothetical protein